MSQTLVKEEKAFIHLDAQQERLLQLQLTTTKQRTRFFVQLLKEQNQSLVVTK